MNKKRKIEKYYSEELSDVWESTPSTLIFNEHPQIEDGVHYEIGNSDGEHVTGLFHGFQDSHLLKICNHTQFTVPNPLIHPYRMIPLLVMYIGNNRFVGTGYFISPLCILTCAHNLYPFSSGSRYVDKVDVIPCYSVKNNTAPLGFSTSFTFYVPDNWKLNVNNSSYAIQYDVGVVVLPDRSLYEKVGAYFRLSSSSSSDKIFNAGYREVDYDLWSSTGRAKLSNNRLSIKYDADTETGHSGSPLFNFVDGNFYSYGIHTNGTCPNEGVAINNNVILYINKIINIHEKIHIILNLL